MTSTTSYCGTCAAANLGTRFCESCGTAVASSPATVAHAPVTTSDGAAGSPDVTSSSTPEAQNTPEPMAKTTFRLYLGAYTLGGLVAVVNALASSQFYRGDPAWTNVVGFLFLVTSTATVLALLMALLSSQVSTARKSWSLVLVLINPVLIAIGLLAAVTNPYIYYSSPLLAISLTLSGLAPVFAFLAWVLVSGYPGRSFAALPIVFVLAVLSLFVGRNGYGSSPLVIIGTLLDVGGVVLSLLVATRLAQRSSTVQSYADPASGTFPTGGASRTNTLSVLALIFGLLGGTVLPIVFGHIARSQIRRTGETGDGLALAGLILGYISSSVVVVILIVAFASAAGSGLHF